MASKAGFASAAAAAMERAAAPKKPWRYYYVMSFPLSNAPSTEKLAGMLEMTDAIEAREEAYLQRMLDRDLPPPRDERASPLARYTATTLTWLSAFTALVALAAVVVTYYLHLTATGDALDPRVWTAAYAIAASVFAQSVALLAALKLQSTLLLRACVVLLTISIGGAVFLLDEIGAVHSSQQQLLTALEQPRTAFTDAQVDRVLNGNETPSLWHRFLVDGPAWFLLWLERHCVPASGTSFQGHDGEDAGDDESAVDTAAFFAPFWKASARQCARDCLATHLQIEAMLRGVVTGVIVVLATQIALCVLLVWIDQFDDGDATANSSDPRAASARPRKRRERRQKRKSTATTAENGGVPLPISLLGIVRLACGGLALTGGFLTVASLTLLSSCSFVGPTESWTLVLAALFGVLQVLVALCTVLLWREPLVKSLLVGGLALESYWTSSLTAFSVALTTSSLGTSPRAGDTVTLLHSAFDFVFQQTCQPIKHWRLHVCVLGAASTHSPHGVAHTTLGDSPMCQDQLAALLRATAQHAIVLLSWMMAAQAIVLVWLVLPSVRALVQSLVALLCCRAGSSSASGRVDPLKSLQQNHAEPAATKRWKHATLPLAKARQLYLSTIKRTDEPTLQSATAAFDAEWTKMTRAGTSSSDVVFTHQFEAIVRALVLRRLTTQCKLDVSLSVSRDGTLLLARIFASDNLLMTTLCQCDAAYKLQLADAVDPSETFWRQTPRELKNDATLLDAHTVHQKLKLLQLHGVVTRQEAEIFPTESQARVSARVHALMRIHRARQGEIQGVRNTYAAFVAYRPQRALQFVYKRFPNRLDTRETAQQRRAAVLRTIDGLRLTRRLLDSEFDLDRMHRRGLLHHCTPLHSASRFDGRTSRAALLASWLAFWRALPAHDSKPWQRASPFRQPLGAVRDYFGECIAFYFAWLACYCQWLVLPTMVSAMLLATHTLDATPLQALAAFGAGTADGNHDTQLTLAPSAVAFGLAVVAWATAFAKAWERRSVWYALEWGMDADDADDDVGHADRANFRGERRRNPVTQQLEVHFPHRQRVPRQLASALVVVVAGTAHVLVCLLLLLAQGVATPWLGLRGAVALSCLAVALLVLWNGDAISALAHALSEWENYQSERAFQRGVVFKVCALQLFNAYGPLLLVAFGLYHMEAASVPPVLHGWAEAFQARVASHVGVLIQLQLLLALVFVTRIASHVLQMAHGLCQHSLRPPGDHGASSAAVERELALPAYRGAYEDYTEIVVQLGLVAMFSSVFPLAPVLALVECALELRLDALDLCLFLQRPPPERASGIGPWAACVRGVLALAVCVALALLYFVADNYAPWSTVRRVGAFVASVGVAFVAMELLWLIVPSQGRSVDRVRARQAFVVDKYFGDAGEGGGDDTSSGRRADNKGERGGLREAEKRALKTSGAEEEEDMEVDGEATPAHYQERLSLLRRLNTALRKQHDEATAPPLEDVDEATEEINAARGQEEDEERAIVGYFVRREASPAPPAPSPPPPPPQDELPRELSMAVPSVPVEAPQTEHVEVTVEAPTGAAAAPADDPTAALVEQYERTALAGLNAIHVAAERERFDFAQDVGWEPQQGGHPRRGSFSKALSRRFSLFRKRRASMDAASPATEATAPTAPTVAPTAGTRVSATPQTNDKKKKKTETKKPPAPRARENSGAQLPVVQLSGLEAVHEAARRDQFDFSTDPWRDATL